MGDYGRMREFEVGLKATYEKEFAREDALVNDLFDLYLEAVDINSKQWHSRPEKMATFELMGRVFNDLHAGWKLIMQGISGQGIMLLRDTIECAIYIKLFEVDNQFRDEWVSGKNFFLRDIRARLKKNKISPPPQDQLYQLLSQTYTHPSTKGSAWQVVDMYPVPQTHEIVCMYGGVEDVPRTRFAALAALNLTHVTMSFLWCEMFPLDGDAHQVWYERLAVAEKQLCILGTQANSDVLKFYAGQLATTRKILDEHLRSFLGH